MALVDLVAYKLTHLETFNLSVEIKIMLIFLSLILGSLTYLYIEIPIRKFKGDIRLIVFPLILFLLLCGFIGMAFKYKEGFPNRFQVLKQNLINYEYDYKTNFRENVCHLTATYQNENSFSEICEDTKKPKKLVLWGDSTAAHLYTGLKLLLDTKNFGISQYTTFGCQP